MTYHAHFGQNHLTSGSSVNRFTSTPNFMRRSTQKPCWDEGQDRENVDHACTQQQQHGVQSDTFIIIGNTRIVTDSTLYPYIVFIGIMTDNLHGDNQQTGETRVVQCSTHFVVIFKFLRAEVAHCEPFVIWCCHSSWPPLCKNVPGIPSYNTAILLHIAWMWNCDSSPSWASVH